VAEIVIDPTQINLNLPPLVLWYPYGEFFYSNVLPNNNIIWDPATPVNYSQIPQASCNLNAYTWTPTVANNTWVYNAASFTIDAHFVAGDGPAYLYFSAPSTWTASNMQSEIWVTEVGGSPVQATRLSGNNWQYLIGDPVDSADKTFTVQLNYNRGSNTRLNPSHLVTTLVADNPNGAWYAQGITEIRGTASSTISISNCNWINFGRSESTHSGIIADVIPDPHNVFPSFNWLSPASAMSYELPLWQQEEIAAMLLQEQLEQELLKEQELLEEELINVDETILEEESTEEDVSETIVNEEITANTNENTEVNNVITNEEIITELFGTDEEIINNSVENTEVNSATVLQSNVEGGETNENPATE